MKLSQLFEDGAVTGTADVSGGVSTAGDMAGVRFSLFGQPSMLKRKKTKIGKTKIIRYHHENNWNVR